jgi:trans-aconitate 2-methyltransferase
MRPPPRDWDAASYQRVSAPHEEWALSILDRLELAGDERVLDAGCGSGRVTSMLIERLPAGSVVAVDGSPSMIEEVRSVLRPQDEALVGDLAEVQLDEPVDVVFSSAVFHWVLDHDALFRNMRRALKPGGRLAAQNGGAGNIARLRRTSEEVAARDPYAAHFEGFGRPWNYAAPGETEERLLAAGFAEARCWLQPWDIVPPEPAEFLRTVCLGPHMDRLPEELRDPFIADVLALEDDPLILDYVRLNIDARLSAERPSIHI